MFGSAVPYLNSTQGDLKATGPKRNPLDPERCVSGNQRETIDLYNVIASLPHAGMTPGMRMNHLEPTNEIHYAGGQLVHLLVAPDRIGGWKATILGSSVAEASFLESLPRANLTVREMFQRTFPKHVCGAKCRPLGGHACRQAG